ncbi:class I SAM-dependent methyltransferase [Microlunatus parietis]|uniref:Ubiquinone/menaquinone biosynthesis C-methylase UbiE n=1 Tax=Microlunatus parietis TaxID=682979 RepID=A0A7Y9L8S6_9ACTN|nr:class I SAM-dependent methyltransferase [Microlunatus parietis]NYE68777.1 ubiquinone/menaquinone biosynthesis C-methylase UbiE [Microlunatus parietis]
MRASRWNETENAEAYAAFTHRFPMYADTSRDVVERADVSAADGVLDLCCGTGATTRVLLPRLPDRAQVWAVDGSPAMIDVAKAETADPRVTWIRSAAEEVDRCRAAAAPLVDAVVCNSAIWQTELPVTFAAVRRVLRPGGRFVFNIGSQFLRYPGQQPRELPPETANVVALMRQAAIEEFGYQPQPLPRRRQPLTPDGIRTELERAGFRQLAAEDVEYDDPPELIQAWLEVPIFADNVCPGLPYPQQRRALELAVQRVVPGPREPARWCLVTASAEPAHT